MQSRKVEMFQPSKTVGRSLAGRDAEGQTQKGNWPFRFCIAECSS